MNAFAYTSASDLEAAVALLAATDGTRPLAGGTDLLPLIKGNIERPARLLDLKRAAGLHDRISITDRETTIGALATLAEIETHRGLLEAYPALVQAAGLAASPQLRNMATIGGNLLQRPRCWYFRGEHFHCWLKGGQECFAREGENQQHALFASGPCVAASPSDPASALLAYGAAVAVRGPGGTRTVPLADLFAEPEEARRTETTLECDEIITEIRLPAPAPGTRSRYLKAMDRKVWAFALVGAAVVLTVDEARITSPRVVLTGVAPIPYRAHAAERILDGQSPSSALFTEAARGALAGAQPLARNRYKLPLAEALIARALSEAVTPSTSALAAAD